MKEKRKIVGIDASRIRSGGAVAHVLGLLEGSNPQDFGIDHVHIWCNEELGRRLPDKSWLTCHMPKMLNKNLLYQILWQKLYLGRELRKYSCDLLFNLDGSTFCTFVPCITLSQDMLSYEPGIIERYPFSLAKLRLLGILYLQNLAFRRSLGVIFLTEYAAKVIQLKAGKIKNYTIIPHGIDKKFYSRSSASPFRRRFADVIRCIYVSNADIYKNQLAVIEAVKTLRDQGMSIQLRLVGGGSGPVQEEIDRMLASTAGEYDFLKQLAFLASDELPPLIQESDIYIFASSCENLPITLLEGMASGVPIACSESGPMPEVIHSGAVFFDPKSATSIAHAIEYLVRNPEDAQALADRALEISKRYNWETTSRLTWRYISDGMH